MTGLRAGMKAKQATLSRLRDQIESSDPDARGGRASVAGRASGAGGERGPRRDHNIVLFRPMVRLNFRQEESIEVYDKETIFKYSHYVESVVMGPRLEVDPDGVITYDSMGRTQKMVEEEGLDQEAENVPFLRFPG